VDLLAVAALIGAAIRAGVGHVVMVSSLGAELGGVGSGGPHLPGERLLTDSALSWAVLLVLRAKDGDVPEFGDARVEQPSSGHECRSEHNRWQRVPSGARMISGVVTLAWMKSRCYGGGWPIASYC
jgi:hypothetical protein